jgi:hypothetical protein
MAVLTNAELVAAVAALEWVANRADLATVLNRFMQAEKKPPTVTKKMLAKAVNFLKSQNGEAAQTARIARGMKIKEWLRTGELEGTERDTKALLKVLGGMLDSESVDAIVGPNLFQGSDGRYYTVVVEASIEEASDDFVQDVLQDLYDEGDDEDDDSLADDEEPEVVEVTVSGEQNGQPYPPDDPDTRPGPRFGPPPGKPGKPLVEVLDTSDTPPLRIADILDRVEAEAVAKADEETIARRDFILQTASAEIEREVTADEVKEAWEKFGAWHYPTLTEHTRQLAKKLGDAMGMGEDTQDEYRQAVIVGALRANGVDSIDDMGLAAELEAKAKPSAGGEG